MRPPLTVNMIRLVNAGRPLLMCALQPTVAAHCPS
jgi:hypothetical protein